MRQTPARLERHADAGAPLAQRLLIASLGTRQQKRLTPSCTVKSTRTRIATLLVHIQCHLSTWFGC